VQRPKFPKPLQAFRSGKYLPLHEQCRKLSNENHRFHSFCLANFKYWQSKQKTKATKMMGQHGGAKRTCSSAKANKDKTRRTGETRTNTAGWQRTMSGHAPIT